MYGQASRLRALKQPVTPESPLLALHRDGDVKLEWRQPRWDQYFYRLESVRGLLAVMQTVGFLKLATTIQTATGVYSLQSSWSGDLKLSFAGESEPRSHYRPDWWFGGRLTLRRGESLRWKALGLKAHQLETEDGFALATFAGSKEWFKSGSEVTVHDALWRRDDATELICMAFAVLVIATRRASD